MTSVPSVIKQPTESRLYTMDFSGVMAPGETILSITSVTVDKTTVPALSISGQVFSGVLAQFRLAAGQAGTRYKVTVIVVTSAGNTLEGEGFVQCEDI